MCLVDLGSLPGAQGPPGLSGPDHRFPTFFSNRFLNGFFMLFTSILDDFWKVFRRIYLPFSSPIFGRFPYRISLFLHSFFFGEPSPTRVLLGNYYGSRTCTFFEKLEFSCKAIPKNFKM